MLKDKLIEFSRSKDVLYAIDAKVGNGRLLSPIQGKLSLLDQDLTASTFEEKQGYLRNEGCLIENGEYIASGLVASFVDTPIDLRGRDTSFTLICKGNIDTTNTSYSSILFTHGQVAANKNYHIASIWHSSSSSNMYYMFSFTNLSGEWVYNYGLISSSTNTQYLNKEMIFVLICDFENSITKLYADGELIGSSAHPSGAVCINNIDSTQVDDYANIKLLGIKSSRNYNSSISYFAFVDYAMTAEEIVALGEAGGGTLELIEEDTSQWQSFTMNGSWLTNATFTLVDGVYTYGAMSFTATDSGWSLDGYAAGLTTTDDVEYPYQATNWLQAGSAVDITFTNVS